MTRASAALLVTLLAFPAAPLAAEPQRAVERRGDTDGGGAGDRSSGERGGDDRGRRDDDRGRGDVVGPASKRDEARPGPVVVSPTVTAPTRVGNFTVGAPVVVGSSFVVGGSIQPAGAPAPETGKRESRRDRHDDRDTLVVPVYVAVPVAVETVIEVAAEPAATSSSSRSRALDPRVEAPPVEAAKTLIPFTPWYYVSEGIVAGVSVPLPPAETFEQGNISSSVAELRPAPTNSERPSRTYQPGIGGLSFDIEPVDAAVFVDGRFVGSVDDFAPDREPLLLRLGGYRVELRAPGYRTESFSVSVTMGEVMPFRGTLSKAESQR